MVWGEAAAGGAPVLRRTLADDDVRDRVRLGIAFTYGLTGASLRQ